MNLIYSFIVALLFIKYFKKSILRNSSYYYIASVVIAAICAYSTWNGIYIKLPNTIRIMLVYPFTKGAISTALFIVVMYIGCFKRKSILYRKLMPIRAELSIIASILMFGHNLGYTKRYFVALFIGKRMPKNFYYASILSLIMIAILIPLFITSFKKIRRMMKPKSWKNLQKLSYIFYGFIWVHVLLIYYPSAFKGSSSAIATIAIYNIIFISYAFLRLQKYICDKREMEHIFSMGKAILMSFVVMGIVLYPAFNHINELKNNKYIDNDVKNGDMPNHSSLNDNNKMMEENESNGTNKANDTAKTEGKSDGAELSSSSEMSGKSDEMMVDDNPKVNDSSEKKDSSENTQNFEQAGYKDGVYEANAMGYVDLIYVRVTVEGGVIAKIDILDENEDVEYMVNALDIIDVIIEKNSTKVDTISGATVSADAIRYAVRKALKQAK